MAIQRPSFPEGEVDLQKVAAQNHLSFICGDYCNLRPDVTAIFILPLSCQQQCYKFKAFVDNSTTIYGRDGPISVFLYQVLAYSKSYLSLLVRYPPLHFLLELLVLSVLWEVHFHPTESWNRQ